MQTPVSPARHIDRATAAIDFVLAGVDILAAEIEATNIDRIDTETTMRFNLERGRGPFISARVIA